MEGKAVKEIPWALIAPHEQQAKTNHQQTIQRLSERGGLHPLEAVAVIQDTDYRKRWPGGDGRSERKDLEAMTREAESILLIAVKTHNETVQSNGW